jgi:hypothetical protein
MSSLGTGSTIFKFSDGNVLPNPPVTSTNFGIPQQNMVLNQHAGNTNIQDEKYESHAFESSNDKSQPVLSKVAGGISAKRRNSKRERKQKRTKKNRKRKIRRTHCSLCKK